MTVSNEAAFQAASAVAFAGWLLLWFAPRRPAVLVLVRFGIVGLLATAYVVLVARHLGAVEGGGFMTLAGVKALLSSDPVILAGWIHYLAFDLVAGLWIAERADRDGIGRLVQLPFLAATLMLGPAGLLAFYALLALRRDARSAA